RKDAKNTRISFAPLRLCVRLFVRIPVSAFHGGAAMPKSKSFVEVIELQGHIIDSLLLPKVLDEILTRGGTYTIKQIDLGKRQIDPSQARIEIKAESQKQLDEILHAVHEHGASPMDQKDCE